MELRKDVYDRMDKDVLGKLLTNPGAYKAWVVCLLEGIGADEMLNSHRLYEKHGLNPRTLRTHEKIINQGLDEYYYVESLFGGK